MSSLTASSFRSVPNVPSPMLLWEPQESSPPTVSLSNSNPVSPLPLLDLLALSSPTESTSNTNSKCKNNALAIKNLISIAVFRSFIITCEIVILNWFQVLSCSIKSTSKFCFIHYSINFYSLKTSPIILDVYELFPNQKRTIYFTSTSLF